MIGKGKSIAHTLASMSYAWSREKNTEIVYSQYVAGENPREITKEFEMIQELNRRCEQNTLSFVLSPTIKDGKKLRERELSELTRKFIKEMELKNRQAIAFVHRDKQHTHVHLYVNRIGFDGKAYKDNFIGKRSQQMAHEVAREMGLTTVRDVQLQQQERERTIRQEIKRIHEKVMEQRPRDLDRYIQQMKQREVQVIPTINRSNELQGFRMEYKGHNFKASEVHRSMSGGRIVAQLERKPERFRKLERSKELMLSGKALQLSTNLAQQIMKRVIKRTIEKGIGMDMGI